MENRPNQENSKGKRQTRYTLKSQFMPVYELDPGEINNEKSQTWPDMSISLSQLVLNHTRGITTDIQGKQEMYFDEEIPIVQDLTDLDAIRERNAELLATYNEEQKIASLKASKEAEQKRKQSIIDEYERTKNAPV